MIQFNVCPQITFSPFYGISNEGERFSWEVKSRKVLIRYFNSSGNGRIIHNGTYFIKQESANHIRLTDSTNGVFNLGKVQ
jgi:hypothetical protein